MDIIKFNKIKDSLPSSIKMKLDHILRFLGSSQRKASIMVGAGFSLNANRDSSVEMKDWNGLGKMFFTNLFGKEATSSDLIDPIRLASQIEACFGKNELNELVLRSLPDDKITPGQLHYQLVELPWRDIFTTNYDTLIERAASEENPTFTVVTNKETLLYKPFPRIIKLHGSFKEIRPFIISEEDYRTYPQTHPEFVNTVRQSLIEGLLCLVGFSGNDPNFLSWIGWLRDVMGDSAAPIYLINISSNLHESEIKLNQKRGISIIDLGEISIDENTDKYKERLDFFFTYLSKGLNDEQVWNPYVNSRWSDKEEIGPIINELINIRETYPGWHLLPAKYYRSFDNIINEIPFIDKKLPKWNLSNEKIIELLYELDWVNQLTCTPYNLDWFKDSIVNLRSAFTNLPEKSKRKLLSLNISLLTLYRYSYDKENFNKTVDFIKSHLPNLNAIELYRRFIYERALYALVSLDRVALRQILIDWKLQDSDYLGVLWKSSILLEIGGEENYKDAFDLLSKSSNKIKVELLVNNSSKELLSLQALLEQSLSIAKGRLLPYIDNSGYINENENLSLTRILESFRLNLYTKQVKPSIQRIHKFGIGSFTTTRNFGGRGYNQEYLQSYRYLRTYERAGYPYGLPDLTINQEGISYALSKISPFDIGISMSVLLRAQNAKLNDEVLNRELLSKVSKQNAKELFSLLFKPEEYQNKAFKHKLNYELFLLSILSRFSIKLEEDDLIHLLRAQLNSYLENNTNSRVNEYRLDDIKIIYSNLPTNKLSEHYDDILAAYINGEEKGGIPIPRRKFGHITINDELVQSFIESLKSKVSDLSDCAYNGIAHFYQFLNETQKERINNAIRNWRNTSRLNSDMLVSFNLVSPDENEQVSLSQYLSDKIKSIIDMDVITSSSSIPIQNITSDLFELSYITHFLNNTQKTNILAKIEKTLEMNKELLFSKNDNMFSFFDFGSNFISSVTHFITSLTTNDNFSEELLESTIRELIEYQEHGFAVLNAIVKVNTLFAKPFLGKREILNLIEKSIFSNEYRLRTDALNAMMYNPNPPSYHILIREMIRRIEIGTNESISNVLSTLCSLYYNGIIRDNDLTKLPEALESLNRDIMNFPISEDYRTDIYYYVLEFVGALSVNEKNSDKLTKAIALWEEYSKNEETFNDVRIGFEKGKEIAISKRRK